MGQNEVAYDCDVTQGFNFRKDVQAYIGHINTIKVGGTDLAVDLTITDPTDLAGDKIKVVGVMSGFYWEGGYANSIQLSAQVSNLNQKNVSIMTNTDLSDTSVEFTYTVYTFDYEVKKYYKCCHSGDETLLGLVEKDSSGGLALTVEADQSTEVMSPMNFAFEIGIMPEDTEQAIHRAVSDSDKFVLNWGVTVAE